MRVLPKTKISYVVTKKYYGKQTGDITVTQKGKTTSITMVQNPEKTLKVTPTSVEYKGTIKDSEKACKEAKVNKLIGAPAYSDATGADYTFTWVFKATGVKAGSKIIKVSTSANFCFAMRDTLVGGSKEIAVTVTNSAGTKKFLNTSVEDAGLLQKIWTYDLTTLPTAAELRKGIKYNAKRGATEDKRVNWYGAHIEVTYIEP